MPNLNEWRDEVHAVAREHGWWEGTDHNIPEKLALIAGEAVGEALEDYRYGQMELVGGGEHGDGTQYKPTGFPIELADVIIRVLDLCAYLNIDIEDMVRIKNSYNRTRPYRHGDKRC